MCLNMLLLFWFEQLKIEADQLREHVVNSWADQVSDKEEVKTLCELIIPGLQIHSRWKVLEKLQYHWKFLKM